MPWLHVQGPTETQLHAVECCESLNVNQIRPSKSRRHYLDARRLDSDPKVSTLCTQRRSRAGSTSNALSAVSLEEGEAFVWLGEVQKRPDRGRTLQSVCLTPLSIPHFRAKNKPREKQH